MAKRNSRDELVGAYISGLGLTVICLLTQADDPERVAFEMAPWPGPELAEKSKLIGLFTFAKPGHAELVISQCGSDLCGSEAALLTFHAAVAAVGAEWRTTIQIVESAEKAVEEIEAHVKLWNQVGGLSAFNKAYKGYRKMCVDIAVPAIVYSAYLHSFKLKVAALIGRNIAGGADKFAGFSAIVPSLIADIDGATSSLPVLRNTSIPYVDRLNYEPPHHTRKNIHHMRRLKV